MDNQKDQSDQIENGTYCVRCKKITSSLNQVEARAKNGRKISKGECGDCGMIKTKFIK